MSNRDEVIYYYTIDNSVSMEGRIEHLIANSGLQFISREINFNPSSRPSVEGEKPLDYYFIEKQETDEITGEEEILFDFLCQSNNGMIPLKELLESQDEDSQLETLPTGRTKISKSGLPSIKQNAETCLYSTYSINSNGVFHIPTLDSMLVNKTTTGMERIPIYKLLLNKWLPFPLFEEQLDGVSKLGPNGWCRAKIELLDENRNGINNYRITWALDTDLGEDFLDRERVLFEINEKSTKKFSICNVADKLMGFLFSEKNGGFSKYAEYIDGLKRGDNRITEAFFYGLCNYTLNDIKYSLMQNVVEYDELVNELYMDLSKNDWHKLDTFKGLNGCTLRSWMSNITWRFFNKQRERLLRNTETNIDNLTDGDYVDGLDELISKEVEDTLSEMSNEEYAQVLRWMFIEGYDASEVATMLDKKISNVYNIKHRAIVQFVNIYNSK